MYHQSKKTKLRPILLTLSFLAFSCVSMAHAQPWEETHKLLASDGTAFDLFGDSVATDANLTMIGAIFDDDNGKDSGSAYVYDVNTGEQLYKLLASDGAAGDFFGTSASISGNLGLVGASLNDDNGINSGSAYVFDVKTGQQLFKLLASDGSSFDEFGISVAAKGTTAVIGADVDCSAYFFNLSTGQQMFKLLATNGSANDQFGFSVTTNGNVAIIGARYDNDNGFHSGAAYVFDVTTGRQLFKLLPSDGLANDEFGYSVAVSGNFAVIGAILDDENGSDAGAAYIFDVTTGKQIFKLLPSDGVAGDQFGFSVAIREEIATISSRYDDDNGFHSGSVYLFDISSGKQLFKLLAPDGNEGDQFGFSVAVSKTAVIIGAEFDDDNGTSSGSSYVFQQVNNLTITPTPLIAKQDGTFTITQALPNALTGLIYSLDGLQNTFIRELNVVINLANPKLAVNPRRTDTNGDLQLILPMPTVFSPIDVWFQAVQFSNVTNFVPTQLIP